MSRCFVVVAVVVVVVVVVDTHATHSSTNNLELMELPKPIQLLVLSTLFALSETQGIPDEELTALIDFWRQTNGPTWRRKRWPAELADYPMWYDSDAGMGGVEDEDGPDRKLLKPCTWKGVSCRNGHVVELSLEKSLDGGYLPESLSALKEVEVLDLGSNKLTGKLPASWGYTMQKLVQIELDGNHFTGMVPAEWKFFVDGRRPPQEGSAAGGARVFLGFNKDSETGKFGFQCPYPIFLTNNTQVTRNRKPVKESNIATSWGLPFECGLKDKDETPDEEAPLKKNKKKTKKMEQEL
eukprot:TRINITY_DN94078_c0_g1_i1.p1 TRINITY_DN94078_c0_g1~~TRINITY_DN94078_c0_g1_i1.p1  ORF type:complete len:296 (-),score=61.28 TRINITY_DN94078_c0_g1_i1:67-954(-)